MESKKDVLLRQLQVAGSLIDTLGIYRRRILDLENPVVIKQYNAVQLTIADIITDIKKQLEVELSN